MRRFTVFLVSLAVCCQAAPEEVSSIWIAAAYKTPGGGLMIKQELPKKGAIAWGRFEDSINATGWGKLDIHTSGGVPDEQQHEAAGFVEGFLTARHIHGQYLNFLGLLIPGGKVPAKLALFLEQQIAWAKTMVASSPTSSYWRHVGSILSQMDGLLDGYRLAANQTGLPVLDALAFQVLSAGGDLNSILSAVDSKYRKDFDAMSAEELHWYAKTKGMCSAMVKVDGDYSDLFMGHSTWIIYGVMDRIFKHYNFEPQIPDTATRRMAFSSYPGVLVSIDDFYMMDSGLGMVQTSNNIFKNSLYDLITPRSLLAWQRVRLANSMSKTGKEWGNYFAMHHSGTYPNQYMLVDFNKFTPGKALPDDTLWVVEEIPGLVVSADQTSTLRRGYWPSYNVPFYTEIYKRSGYSDHNLGEDGSYELAPRAKIFRRDEATVKDMQSFKHFMRYANYSDPYSVNATSGVIDYSAAICMRGDLAPQNKNAKPQPPGGCIDTKVTSYLSGFRKLTAEVVNGPTSTASDGTGGRSGNAPFIFTDKTIGVHYGVPDKMTFDFITAEPKNLTCSVCQEEGESDILI